MPFVDLSGTFDMRRLRGTARVASYVRVMDELHRLNSTHDSIDEPLGSPVSRRDWKMRPRARRAYGSPVLSVDLVASIVLTVAQAIASGYLVFLNVFLGFAFDACGDPYPSCNYALGTAACLVVPVVAVVVLITTIVLVTQYRRKSRLGWWIPLAGIGTTIVSLGLAMVLMSVAIGRPLW